MPLTPAKLANAKLQIIKEVWKRNPSMEPAMKMVVDLIGEAEEVEAGGGVLAVKMDKPADPAAGVTKLPVGFQLKDPSGANPAAPMTIQMAAFKDALCGEPYHGVELRTPTAGSIAAGGGSAAIQAQTDATGKFTCELFNPYGTTVYLACCHAFGSGGLDCSETDLITFLPAP